MSLRRAFAANIVPAVALWSFASLLLLLYWFNPPTQAALNALAGLKIRLGLGFSMPAQAFAAGFLPFLFQKFQRGDHKKTQLVHVPYFMLCWAVMGAITDWFYTFQAFIFGDSKQITIIVSKVAVDMLLYCPLVSMPLVVTMYAFRDAGFNWARMKQDLGKGWYKTRVWPVYMAALLVWVPAVTILYALPLALQFPFQAIVQCLWGLILVILASK